MTRMSRKTEIVAKFARGAYVAEQTETFTHRQQLPDGRVILANPTTSFYRINGEGWYVTAPDEWEESKAERLAEPLVQRRYYEDFK
jgi:hypothetical protein